MTMTGALSSLARGNWELASSRRIFAEPTRFQSELPLLHITLYASSLHKTVVARCGTHRKPTRRLSFIFYQTDVFGLQYRPAVWSPTAIKGRRRCSRLAARTAFRAALNPPTTQRRNRTRNKATWRARKSPPNDNNDATRSRRAFGRYSRRNAVTIIR